MQRLWTNPIKVKFARLSLSDAPAPSLAPALLLCVYVIFQTISQNMCFGFQSAAVKNPVALAAAAAFQNAKGDKVEIMRIVECVPRNCRALWLMRHLLPSAYHTCSASQSASQPASQPASQVSSQCRNIGLGQHSRSSLCENQGLKTG